MTRLKKQPRLRHMRSAGVAAIPRVVVPPDARRRKRRNSRTYQLPLATIKRAALSARWGSLLVLAICTWALVTVAGNDSFFLNAIPVEGGGALPASEIVARSGLAGIHIFAADPNEAAERIAEIPGIISAEVVVKWPNEASIQVTESSPVALWKQDGRTYWIDDGGQLIPSRAKAGSLLVIESEEGEPVTDDTFVSGEILAGALRLRELRANIDHLYYDPGNGLSYQDGRGWRAYFGSGQRMEQKLVVYETIVDDLQEKAVSPAYISVRNVAKPYYMASGG